MWSFQPLLPAAAQLQSPPLPIGTATGTGFLLGVAASIGILSGSGAIAAVAVSTGQTSSASTLIGKSVSIGQIGGTSSLVGKSVSIGQMNGASSFQGTRVSVGSAAGAGGFTGKSVSIGFVSGFCSLVGVPSSPIGWQIFGSSTLTGVSVSIGFMAGNSTLQGISVDSASIDFSYRRPNLFGADIAGAIYEALAPGFLPATLTRPLPGARNPATLTAGQSVGASVATYDCRGFCDDYTHREMVGTTVREGDRKILLLGKSLPDSIDPQPGDIITIEQRAWRIVGPVKRDPAGATFICQVRQ